MSNLLRKVMRAVQAGYDEFGREVPDPTPVATLAPFRPQLSLEDRIKLCMRSVYLEQQRASADEFDSPEDADDFDIEDDDPYSPHEIPEREMFPEEGSPKLDPDPKTTADPSEIPRGSGGEAPQEDQGGPAPA